MYMILGPRLHRIRYKYLPVYRDLLWITFKRGYKVVDTKIKNSHTSLWVKSTIYQFTTYAHIE